MPNKIKEIIAVFENDDVLVLSCKESTFAGYKPERIFELKFGEKTSEGFNAYQTEYFPITCFDAAKIAFNKRLNSSNPSHESDTGWSLDQMLTKA